MLIRRVLLALLMPLLAEKWSPKASTLVSAFSQFKRHPTLVMRRYLLCNQSHCLDTRSKPSVGKVATLWALPFWNWHSASKEESPTQESNPTDASTSQEQIESKDYFRVSRLKDLKTWFDKALSALSNLVHIPRDEPAPSTDTAHHVKDDSLSLPESTREDRNAKAADGIDLSGTWKPIVTAEFKKDYGHYLECCGENGLKRQFYMSVVSLTGERLRQYNENDASQLELTGTSPVGEWKRTLIASAPSTRGEYPILTPVRDPDGDTVTVEAWWTNHGTVHESWMRGKPRVEGGSFQSLRYLEPKENDKGSDNNGSSGDILVCESHFHPAAPANADKSSTNGRLSRFQPGFVKWRFQRVST